MVDALTMLEFFSNGQKITEGAEIVVPEKDYTVYTALGSWSVYFNLAAHNSSNRVIDASDVSLLLITLGIGNLSDRSDGRSLRLPDGRFMLAGNTIGRLLPDDWSSQRISIEFPLSERLDRALPVVLRLSPTGSREISFSCRLEKPLEVS